MTDRTDRIIAVLQASKLPGARVMYKFPDNTWGNPFEPSMATWKFDNGEYKVLAPSEGKSRHITAKDWDGQATVWVRLTPTSMTDFLVDQIDDVGFSYIPFSDRREIRWNDYRIGYETNERIPEVWSFDRKTWHSFVVSDPGEMRVVASTEEKE